MKNKTEEYKSPIIEDLLNEVPSCEANKIYYKMELAIRIFEAMQAKGWNKSTFAKKTNQNASVITKWLSGTHNFTVDTLGDIGYILDVDFLSNTKDLPKNPPKDLPIMILPDLKSDNFVESLQQECLMFTISNSSNPTTFINKFENKKVKFGLS